MVLSLELYVNSVTRDWAGYGLRRMVDYYPLFASGLACSLTWVDRLLRRRSVGCVVLPFVGLNWITLAYYYWPGLLRGEFHFR